VSVQLDHLGIEGQDGLALAAPPGSLVVDLGEAPFLAGAPSSAP
jgi:hypothetical protein